LAAAWGYLDNRPVAALVYGRRKHFVNFCVWAAASDTAKAPKTITREGYQLLHWAVSDVNANDLQLFEQQFETRSRITNDILGR
jgi:anti-sigma factor RsiW